MPSVDRRQVVTAIGAASVMSICHAPPGRTVAQSPRGQLSLARPVRRALPFTSPRRQPQHLILQHHV